MGIIFTYHVTQGEAACPFCYGLVRECPGEPDSYPLFSLTVAGVALIASYATTASFVRFLSRVEPFTLGVHLSLGTLGASIVAVRSSICRLCSKSARCLDQMRATFTSTLDHTVRSPFDAASYFVRSIRTVVVRLTNPLFLEYLQEAYNSTPGCSYHSPCLLSYSWRLALHMSSSDQDDILNDDVGLTPPLTPLARLTS